MHSQSIAPGSSGAANGGTLDNGVELAYHSAICTGSAGVSAGAFKLQISHDGTSWLDAGAPVTVTASTVQTQSVTAPARYIRAVISTAIVGGTVGITVASAG